MKRKTFEVVKNNNYSVSGESRYVIIEPETREILDDANGAGYKTYKKALRCAFFKIKHNMRFVKDTEN